LSRSLSGTNDLLTIGSAVVDATAIETTPVSVAIWVKRGRTSAAGVERLVVAGVAAATNNQISIGINTDNTVFCRTRSTGDADATSSATIADTTNWHLIVGVWAGIADRTIYVDDNAGVPNTTSRDPSTTTNLFRIGASADNGPPYTAEFQGLVAYVTVWNKALSSGEVASLWNSGAGVDPTTVANGNLVAAWDLTGNESPEVDDVGASDLTVVGTTFSTDNPFTVGGGGTVNTETLESTLAVSDEPLDYVFAYRVGEDAITVSDEIVSTVIGTVAKILTDTLDVTDGAAWFIYRTRLLQDSILVNEGNTEQYITTGIVADDTIDIADSIVRYALFTRLGDDALVITDSIVSSIVNYVIREAVLSSSISVMDEASWFIYVTRLAESTVSMFDEPQSYALRFILLSDALSVDDGATATYVPDPGSVVLVNPIIRVGFDQPRIDVGGYALV
jgi:hypothetical protein